MDGQSDDAIRQRLRSRAQALDMSLRDVAAAAAIGNDTMFRTDFRNCKLETLEKIARALQWTLADLLGHEARIDGELSAMALAGARQICERLPKWARTDAMLIDGHASIYDLLVARKQDGQLPADRAECVRIVGFYVDTLVRAWRNGATQSPEGDSAMQRTFSRLQAPRTVANQS